MRNLLIAIIFFVTINGFTPQPVFAELNTSTSLAGAATVDEAVAQIIKILEGRGFDIELVVNHAAAAASVGLDLRPTQVIFARQPPIFERLTRRLDDNITIDLPLKFLVYEDADGEIQVTSNPVGYLVDRFNIKINEPILRLLQLSVNQFGKPASGLISIQSSQTLADTVDSLIAEIESRAGAGFRIPLVLDFTEDDRGRKHRHGGKLSQQVLIVFGNPNVGTPLMQADQRIGLNLPQEYLVSEDKNGQVNII